MPRTWALVWDWIGVHACSKSLSESLRGRGLHGPPSPTTLAGKEPWKGHPYGGVAPVAQPNFYFRRAHAPRCLQVRGISKVRFIVAYFSKTKSSSMLASSWHLNCTLLQWICVVKPLGRWLSEVVCRSVYPARGTRQEIMKSPQHCDFIKSISSGRWLFSFFVFF